MGSIIGDGKECEFEGEVFSKKIFNAEGLFGGESDR